MKDRKRKKFKPIFNRKNMLLKRTEKRLEQLTTKLSSAAEVADEKMKAELKPLTEQRDAIQAKLQQIVAKYQAEFNSTHSDDQAKTEKLTARKLRLERQLLKLGQAKFGGDPISEDDLTDSDEDRILDSEIEEELETEPETTTEDETGEAGDETKEILEETEEDEDDDDEIIVDEAEEIEEEPTE